MAGNYTELIDTVLQSVDFPSTWPSFTIGGIVVAFTGLFIYMVTHPDTVEKWSSIFFRIFSFFSKRAERNAVSTDIQTRLSSFIKNFKIDDVLPYGIRFKWVTDEDFDSYVDEGDVVVIMDNHRNNARNFIKAIMAYTSKGLLPTVRPYLSDEILKATELTLQEYIIKEKRSDALDIFRREVIPQQTENNQSIITYYKKLQVIARAGYFDTIFLNELSNSGPKLQDVDDQIGTQELEQFITFLENLSNREPLDTTVELNHNGSIFRPWVVLVAMTEHIAKKGITPYVKRVNEAVEKNYQSVYMLIREKSIKYLDDLIKGMKEKTTVTMRWKKEVSTRDKEGKYSKAMMILFRV
jgi:hypothetical protein